MLYVLNWSVTAACWALWSFSVWALHALTVWTVSRAGTLTGSATGFGPVRPPDWLAPWVPPELTQAVGALLSSLGPIVESLLKAAPSVAGGVTVASWVIWGMGSALLLVLGAGLHLFLAMWRRRRSGRTGRPHGRTFSAG